MATATAMAAVSGDGGAWRRRRNSASSTSAAQHRRLSCGGLLELRQSRHVPDLRRLGRRASRLSRDVHQQALRLVPRADRHHLARIAERKAPSMTRLRSVARSARGDDRQWTRRSARLCTPGAAPTGTATEYEEGIDIDQSRLNAGALRRRRRQLDQSIGCVTRRTIAPVFPWNFVRTNTVFGVIHDAGMYTAWSDKHPAYASVSGPGPTAGNIDDFYGPEINS